MMDFANMYVRFIICLYFLTLLIKSLSSPEHFLFFRAVVQPCILIAFSRSFQQMNMDRYFLHLVLLYLGFLIFQSCASEM